MKIGVIGIPGNESSEKLAEAVAELTGERILIDLDKIRLELPGPACWCGPVNLLELDGLLIKKAGSQYSPNLLDRLEILRYLAACGVRVFSDPHTIIRMLDRLSCTLSLQAAHIPMPATTITEDLPEALAAVKKYGQAVLKPFYSTKARGMLLLAHDDKELAIRLREYQKTNPMFYIQQMIDLQYGYDLGVTFIGRDYLTTYARVKSGDSWNTTTLNGGHYEPFSPDDEVIKIAAKARDVFDLAFTCVDVALCRQGPLVFEVSAFGGFQGIEKTSHYQPARLVARYVFDKMRLSLGDRNSR